MTADPLIERLDQALRDYDNRWRWDATGAPETQARNLYLFLKRHPRYRDPAVAGAFEQRIIEWLIALQAKGDEAGWLEDWKRERAELARRSRNTPKAQRYAKQQRAMGKHTMKEAEQLRAAMQLAEAAHAGQSDKLGQPYIGHCLRVAGKVDSADAKVVAVLHDILEDTTTTSAELRETFGDPVTDAVIALSRKDEAGKTRPDEEYYAGVTANSLALEVKLADLHDNLDPRRLGQLDTATRRRLMQKYGHALVALAAEPDVPEGEAR